MNPCIWRKEYYSRGRLGEDFIKYEKKVLDHNVYEYSVEGEFTIFFLSNIKAELEKDIMSGRPMYFIFDLQKASYIDSAAIGILLMAGKYNDSKGKLLFVKNPAEAVRRSIDDAQLGFVEYK